MFKRLILIVLLAISFSVAAMEKPDTQQAGQETELDKYVKKELQRPSTKEEMQELLKNARRGNLDAEVKLVGISIANQDFKQAMEWIKKSEAHGYKFPSHVLASIYFALGDINKTKELAEKTIAENKPGIGYEFLAFVKLAEGDQASAWGFYNRAIELGHINAFFLRALLYIDQTKNDLAKKDLLEYQSKTGNGYMARGWISLINNDFKDAIFHFSSSNDVHGLFLAYEKMPSPSQVIVEPMLKSYHPKAGPVYYHFGLLTLKENNEKKAIEYFKKSLQYPNKFWEEPSYPGKAAYQLYKLLLDTKPDQARKYLFEAAKFGEPNAASKVGREYYENESLPKEERLSQAKKYLQIATDKGKLNAKYNLAIIAEYEKDYAKAKELFGKLAKEKYKDAADRLKEVIKKQLTQP